MFFVVLLCSIDVLSFGMILLALGVLLSLCDSVFMRYLLV
jgi:hypothetical protein